MRDAIVLAVDGGNSKTDLMLVRADGEALALVRGPRSSPHYVGVEGCLDVVDDLLARALDEAGLPNGRGPVADIGQLLLAGVDFPTEVEEMKTAANRRRLASRISVANDTFAVLRAGTERGWGVAVVCGTGINCIGVAPDGRHARFPQIGTVSGDWGGGGDVGMAAVFAAARSEDGRGPKTILEHAVPEHFGLRTPIELAEAVHRGRIDLNPAELAPLVLAAAPSDRVAAEIVKRLADEIAALVRVALERLALSTESVEVLLGGGLFLSGDELLLHAVEERLATIAPKARPRVTASQPIVGAALLGLDELDSGAEAQMRLRQEFGNALERIEEQTKDRARLRSAHGGQEQQPRRQAERSSRS